MKRWTAGGVGVVLGLGFLVLAAGPASAQDFVVRSYDTGDLGSSGWPERLCLGLSLPGEDHDRLDWTAGDPDLLLDLLGTWIGEELWEEPAAVHYLEPTLVLRQMEVSVPTKRVFG